MNNTQHSPTSSATPNQPRSDRRTPCAARRANDAAAHTPASSRNACNNDDDDDDDVVAIVYQNLLIFAPRIYHCVANAVYAPRVL